MLILMLSLLTILTVLLMLILMLIPTAVSNDNSKVVPNDDPIAVRTAVSTGNSNSVPNAEPKTHSVPRSKHTPSRL